MLKSVADAVHGATVFALEIVGWLAAIALIFSAARSLLTDEIRFNPPSVPKELEDIGYTPSVSAHLIVDEMSKMEAKAKTVVPIRPRLISDGKLELKIPGTSLTVSSMMASALGFIGVQGSEITGDIYGAKGSYRLVLRLNGKRLAPSNEEGATLDNADAVFNEGAAILLHKTEPYIYAAFLYANHDDRALEIAREIIGDGTSKSQDVAMAYHLWGVILFDHHDFDGAIEKCEHSLKLGSWKRGDRERIVAINMVGNSLLEKGRTEDAIAKFDAAISEDPTFAVPYIGLGKAYASKNQFDDAIRIFGLALERDPKSSAAYFNLGRVFGKQKNFAEALRAYQTAVALDPTDAQNYNALGRTLIDMQQIDDAISALNKAIAINSTYAAAYRNKADAYFNAGRFSESIDNYRSAIRLAPHDFGMTNEILADFHLSLGRALAKNRVIPDAISEFKKSTDLNPNLVLAYRFLGEAQTEIRSFAEAAESLRLAIALDPTDASLHASRGDLLMEMQRWGEAADEYESVIAAYPNDAYIGLTYYRAANARANNNQYEQAEKLIRRALQSDPRETEMWRLLGFILNNLGRFDEAIPILQRTTDEAPEFLPGYSYLGAAFEGKADATNNIEQKTLLLGSACTAFLRSASTETLASVKEDLSRIDAKLGGKQVCSAPQ